MSDLSKLAVFMGWSYLDTDQPGVWESLDERDDQMAYGGHLTAEGAVAIITKCRPADGQILGDIDAWLSLHYGEKDSFETMVLESIMQTKPWK